MANYTITVTGLPTRDDGDTVLGYNIYTDTPLADTLLESITAAEGAAGKVVSLPDGFHHDIKVKTLWTIAGESTTNESNEVIIDLTGDIIAPLVSTVSIEDANPDQLIVTFNEIATITDMTGLSLDGDLLAVTVDSLLSGNGTTILTFQLSAAAIFGNTGNFVYSGANNIIDGAANALVGSLTLIVNNVASAATYKLFLQQGTDLDSLDVKPGDEIDLLHTAPWSITFNYEHTQIPAGNVSVLHSATSISFLKRMSGGEVRCNVGGTEMRWSAAGVLATLDAVEREYILSWTLGDTSPKLSIGGVDYGVANVSPNAPLSTLQFVAIKGTVWDVTVRNMVIVSNGVTHTFPMNEGSGITTTSDTAKVIDITTANAGGATWIDSDVWAAG